MQVGVSVVSVSLAWGKRQARDGARGGVQQGSDQSPREVGSSFALSLLLAAVTPRAGLGKETSSRIQTMYCGARLGKPWAGSRMGSRRSAQVPGVAQQAAVRQWAGGWWRRDVGRSPW